MSGAGSRRAGCWSAVVPPPVVTGGAVHTTAVTTAAGLRTANANTKAKKIRNARGVRRVLPTAPVRSLLVRKIFKLWCQLANPPAIVEAADETGVSLVASHIEELFLGDERAQTRKVRVRAVAHDPADHSCELAPLPLGERFAVARDRYQQGGRGAGDGLGKDLFGLCPSDDLAPGADDVRDPISPDADYVPAASHGRSLEVSRPCVHCQAHYSK